jgi:trigger factor
MTLKDYLEVTGSNLEQVENDIGEQARASVREELALEALFRQMGWEITDEDVDAELASLAGAGEGDPAELRKKWTEAGVIPVLHEQIMHKQAVRWLMDGENVKIIEEETPAESDTGDDKE